MALTLVKGQKIDLTKNNPNLNLIHIGLDWSDTGNFDIDVSAFLVGVDEKIVREEDFVFYGQPISSNRSVRLEESISTIEKQHFMIDLAKVPADVHKISFTFTIYESEQNGQTFQDVSSIQLRIVNSRIQEEVAIFPIDYSFTKETAIELGAIYRHLGEWKFQAVGAGFYGGLADLCRVFGVEVEGQEETGSPNQTGSKSSSPNERFQVVQERGKNETVEEIPKPPADPVQLKRTPFIQFNESRIETLSQQSDVLINLFNEEENESTPLTHKVPFETPSLPPLSTEFLEEKDETTFLQSLSDVEKSFLLLFEDGVVQLDQAKSFLKSKGLMMALFVNTINEKAFNELGDNLLQIQQESIIVYEEFVSLVANMKESKK